MLRQRSRKPEGDGWSARAEKEPLFLNDIEFDRLSLDPQRR